MVNRISSERKVKGNFGTSRCECFEDPLGDVRINFPGTSLERQIRTYIGRHFTTSPGRQIGTYPGRQIGTSPGWSIRIFRGRPGDVGGDVLGTNICWLGSSIYNNSLSFTNAYSETGIRCCLLYFSSLDVPVNLEILFIYVPMVST